MQLPAQASSNSATMDDARQLLRTTFGYPAFRSRQETAIEAVLSGRDALVLMPTGGGKSLCFQIPALLRQGTGIVISPLIALMEDQVRALQELGLRAAFLNSSLSSTEQTQIIVKLEHGDIDLLYVSPERLLQSYTLALLQRIPIALFAIDEAHCVSQWGHDFRQDYLALNQLARAFSGIPRVALTATATPRTRTEIISRLALHDPLVAIGSFDRPNIRYSVQAKTLARRQLLQFLAAHRNEAGIIYCLSRKKVDATAEWLHDHGFDALPYHAGLSAELRARHQRHFVTDEAVIIVATIAFGMGIDKPDVRFVAHLDLPKSLESYYQETGRAGRDGEPADAWLLYGMQDVVQLRQIVEGSEADEEHKRHEIHKLDALLGWCEITQCRRQPLLTYFGEENTAACGNCDNCIKAPATWDGTEAARKLLSAVYRTGQRFGSAHVTDVLLGKETDKIRNNAHDTLSVFGIGSELSQSAWRSVIRQLVVLGFLRADAERYHALVLTELCRPVLRGEVPVTLREDQSRVINRKPAIKSDVEYIIASDDDKTLWEALRECRRELATEHQVPPYVIFHDSTLLEMIRHRPTDEAELLAINGVGEAKLERYGERFLEILRAPSESVLPNPA